MKSKRVAICLVTDSKDNVLMGMRNNSGKWTQPCGHIEIGECPFAGAVRELKEETGLDAEDVKIVGMKMEKKKNLLLYLFKVKVDPDQKIDSSNDPDKECDDWFYVDPNDIVDDLHVPIEENIALKYWAKN